MRTDGRVSRNNQLAKFLSWGALTGGLVAVDFFVARLKDVLRPGQKPMLLNYFDPRVPLAVQSLVAALAVPFNEQTASVWAKCQARLSDVKDDDAKHMAERDTQRWVFVRLARAHLMGKPLPIRPLATPSKSSKTSRGAGNRSGVSSGTKAQRPPTVKDIEALMVEMGIKRQ